MHVSFFEDIAAAFDLARIIFLHTTFVQGYPAVILFIYPNNVLLYGGMKTRRTPEQ